MIRCLKIGDLKIQALNSKVFPCTKGYRQGDLPEWYHRGLRDYAMERRTTLVEFRGRDLYVIEGFEEEDVESTASIDQHPVKFNHPDDRV